MNEKIQHAGPKKLDHVSRAFVIGIVLNVLYVVIEFILGHKYQSYALISDAGHNLSDVFSLCIALLAYSMQHFKQTNRFTYGFRRSTIMVSFINACILLIAVAFIAYEGILKIHHPVRVDGTAVAWIAGFGIIVNGVTSLLFLREQKNDLNIKGAYLHMLADTLVSVGVVISGIIIHFTHWYVLDAYISLFIAVIIVFTAFRLLKQSVYLMLDAVPHTIDLEQVKKQLMQDAPCIRSIYHIHIWSLSTTTVALTAHIATFDSMQWDRDKAFIKRLLKTYGIDHATLELDLHIDNKDDLDCLS